MLQSHADGDDARFYSVAMQVAAHEARQGHGKIAKELRDLIDDAKRNRGLISAWSQDVSRGAKSDLLGLSYPKVRLGDLVFDGHLLAQLRRVVREHRQASRILEQGLSPRRKLLFIGPQGSGKRFAAAVLAGELGIPLIQKPVSGLHGWFKPETPGELQNIFHAATNTRGVYCFAEVGNFNSTRSSEDEADARCQLLYRFLAMVEQDHSHSILVTSMRRLETLDTGLLSCFDDVLEFHFPSERQIARLLQRRLRHVVVEEANWTELASMAAGLSYDEVAAAADDALKLAIMSDLNMVGDSSVSSILAEKKSISEKLNASRTF